MAVPERKPDPKNSDHRVIDFQPRGKKASVTEKPAASSEANRSAGRHRAPIDYRQRMMANLAAAAFAVILAGVGVWLVTTLNHMRQTQDCIVMGLRNCGDSSTPHS
ncbi:MAG: hypothetical protein K2W78_13635 [Xanthobacteraceae bacterium]|nr:hypothetical protein [Xanthobacteraceae bacterium]